MQLSHFVTSSLTRRQISLATQGLTDNEEFFMQVEHDVWKMSTRDVAWEPLLGELIGMRSVRRYLEDNHVESGLLMRRSMRLTKSTRAWELGPSLHGF